MRQETEKVIEIAKEAGKMAMKYFEQLKDHHISTKEDGSVLTIADTEIDAYIRSELEKAFPEHSVLSEESENIKTTEGVWIIDPIDGTKNFANGNPNFGISIGLAINNKPEIGVVYGPAQNKLYVGEVGTGATLNGEPIYISNTKELKGAKILIDKGTKELTLKIHGAIKTAVEKSGAIVEAWSCACLELCAVASGNYDACVHKGLNAWDIVAGIAILESAGGVVFHFDGTEKNIFEPGIVATNKNLKDKIIAITKNI